MNSDFIETLQRELTEQRNDYRFTLAQKDAEIRRLRAELASVTMEPEPLKHEGIYVSKLTPPTAEQIDEEIKRRQGGMAKRPALIPVVTLSNTQSDWATELNKMLSEEEDGIRSERREEVHQPAPDESA